MWPSPFKHWNIAECSESTGKMVALCFKQSWEISFPATTNVSMFARAIVLLYLIILDNNVQSIFLFITFIIILYTHRENIIRLKDSKETKIKL